MPRAKRSGCRRTRACSRCCPDRGSAKSTGSRPTFFAAAAQLSAAVARPAHRRSRGQRRRAAARSKPRCPPICRNVHVLDGQRPARDDRRRRGAARLRHRRARSDAVQAPDGRRLPARAADATPSCAPSACSRSNTCRLPNVLAGEPLVPELLQDDCTPDKPRRAPCCRCFPPRPGLHPAARFRELHLALRRDASARAADAIAELLGRTRTTACVNASVHRTVRADMSFEPATADPAAPPVRFAGVDEAGRGPLAGPVVVAAVVFPPGRTPINGLNDSKQLNAERREELYLRIVERALAFKIVSHRSRRHRPPQHLPRDHARHAPARWKACCTRANPRASTATRCREACPAAPKRSSAATRATARSWPPRSSRR